MPETPWLSETEAAAWAGHLRVAGLLARGINRDLLADAGISSREYDVLAALSEMPQGRARMSELADRVCWSPSRLTHQISRMQQRGLVQRESPAPRAEVLLTPLGHIVFGQSKSVHARSVRRHLLDNLGPDQVHALTQIYASVLDQQPGCDRTRRGSDPDALDDG